MYAHQLLFAPQTGRPYAQADIVPSDLLRATLSIVDQLLK
jgi:hypothetical protein